jgi:predicted enzyme related to lactoylglutathione lyase
VDAEADRTFLEDVLSFRGVDAGEGWMIFKLPTAEVGVHPAEAPFVMSHAGQNLLGAVLYLMCDDVTRTVTEIEARGATCAPIEHAPWGDYTTIAMPSGAAIGLYQPSHPTALHM